MDFHLVTPQGDVHLFSIEDGRIVDPAPAGGHPAIGPKISGDAPDYSTPSPT